MEQTTITATVKWRWWLKHYLLGVVLIARLTGCQPSRERMRYWVDKGIKIEMR